MIGKIVLIYFIQRHFCSCFLLTRFPKIESTTCCLRQHASLSVYSITCGWERDPFAFEITNFPLKFLWKNVFVMEKMKFQHRFPRWKKRLVPSWKKTFSPPPSCKKLSDVHVEAISKFRPNWHFNSLVIIVCSWSILLINENDISLSSFLSFSLIFVWCTPFTLVFPLLKTLVMPLITLQFLRKLYLTKFYKL